MYNVWWLIYETEFEMWSGFGSAGSTENVCNFVTVSYFCTKKLIHKYKSEKTVNSW